MTNAEITALLNNAADDLSAYRNFDMARRLRELAAQLAATPAPTAPCSNQLQCTHPSKCSHAGKCQKQLAAPAPAAPEPLPRFMLEKVQQAIKDATHPKGMSLHDGKARIDASILSRLLMLATPVQTAPSDAQDAARYRYLKANSYIELQCASPKVHHWNEAMLDERIDAELARGTPLLR